MENDWIKTYMEGIALASPPVMAPLLSMSRPCFANTRSPLPLPSASSWITSGWRAGSEAAAGHDHVPVKRCFYHSYWRKVKHTNRDQRGHRRTQGHVRVDLKLVALLARLHGHRRLVPFLLSLLARALRLTHAPPGSACRPPPSAASVASCHPRACWKRWNKPIVFVLKDETYQSQIKYDGDDCLSQDASIGGAR